MHIDLFCFDPFKSSAPFIIYYYSIEFISRKIRDVKLTVRLNFSILTGSQGLLVPANSYPTTGYPTNGISSNGYMVPNGSIPPALNPALQLTVNTVDAVTEAIKSDRSIRFWRMEAQKVSCF